MKVEIESLTHLGMGRGNDGALYPRTLPGEVIEVDEAGHRIVTPSEERVSPACRHYKSCGGCSMQHASDPYVAHWKQTIVERAISAQGLEAPFRPIHTSPARSRRRAKFSGTRTKKGALVGFHARASGMVVSVPQCELLVPELVDLLPALEQLTIKCASRKAEVALTVTQSSAGPDVLIETGQTLTPQLRIELAAFAQTHAIARLTWNDETVVTLVDPFQTFGLAKVTPPPGAFLQATVDGENALKSAVIDTVSDARRIVDLFSGCGTFSLPLAAKAEVHAVESVADMLATLDRGWRASQGLKKVTTEVRDLFRRPLEPDEFKGVEAVVIDPPRAGAEAQVQTLARADVPKVAMVSCNPVTFARDTKVLVDQGYMLDWVQVVDQFRWSAHVEVAASLTRS